MNSLDLDMILLLAQDAAIPTGTFEWIIKNGVAGLLLVVAAVEGWLIWRLLNDRTALEVEYRQKIEKLKDDQAENTEKQMNSRIEELGKIQVLLSENRDAMRRMLKLAGDDD